MVNKPLSDQNAPELSLAFYQPDIPQNIGAAMRLCACMNICMEVIEPSAFLWKDSAFRRTGLDYIQHLTLVKHSSWERFKKDTQDRRLILLTTKTNLPYTDFQFQAGDILLCGSESAGVPDHVHEECEHRVTIPMYGECRSLNVVNAASMITGEALRQLQTNKEIGQ